MGGMMKSAGGFLGLSNGPQAPDVQSSNRGLGYLDSQNDAYSTVNPGSQQFMQGLENYSNGTGSSQDFLNGAAGNSDKNQGLMAESMNALATNPLTGSKFASEQVQNNPILGSLFGKGGQLEGAEGRLNDLQSQGFELKPEDQTLYGQTSGNIARMFGAQGNQVSQDLANRGLASAPSGAAGAMFSGLNGNQNEMLAQAQQGIMQQRFQNTMQQIGQQQNFINSLGQQAGNDINSQYQRQAQGAGAQKASLESAAGLSEGQNQGVNSANMSAANFNVANTPTNAMDYFSAGVGSSLYNTAAAPGKAASSAAGAAGKGAAMGAG